MTIPLPKHWPALARAATLHAIGLAQQVLLFTRAAAESSPLPRVRLAAENARLQSELALLREELRIKDARIERLEPRKRPQYLPAERFDVLALKAARGWSTAQCARRFHVSTVTVRNWLRAAFSTEDTPVLEHGPVNRFPNYVALLVRQLKGSFPLLGRRAIADVLARAGLHLSASTVKRMLDRPSPKPRGPRSSRTTPDTDQGPLRIDTPNALWHIDLTAARTTHGWWVPWIPHALLQFWPFAWWILVVMDHRSRKVLKLRAFRDPPNAALICQVLDEAIADFGAPKDIVSDKGSQFRCQYQAWCRDRGIRFRYGAVGKHGSIAIVERFIRSLKQQHLRVLPVPLNQVEMSVVLKRYLHWYNEHRPHQALGGATPNEIFFQTDLARDGPRFEPRPGMTCTPRRPSPSPSSRATSKAARTSPSSHSTSRLERRALERTRMDGSVFRFLPAT